MILPRAHSARLGALIGGKYRVERFIAEGGMGAVYEARHTVIGRPFAIKFLHTDLADRRELLTRFRREADAAGGLQSEHIAAILDFGIGSDGTPFIVMEYLVGESLAALLQRKGRLPIARAADICLQACRGIEVAHDAGIIHRDLKPQNLFVCRRDDGTDLIKVLDFGVAKLQACDGNTTMTGAGTVLGTPLYMSPEQARGDEVDHRTDVFALGAILYEMVSGRRPHPGDSPNAVLFHLFTQAPVPLETVQPGLAAALRDLVASALAFEPAARPSSAKQLARALVPLAKRVPWPDRSPADPSPDFSEAADTLRAPTSAQTGVPAVPPPKKRRLVWPGVAAAAVALAVASALVAARSSTARPAALAYAPSPALALDPAIPALLVDDFEGRDLAPRGPDHFYPWVAFVFPRESVAATIHVGERGIGQHALDLQFRLADPANGTPDYGGAGCGVYASNQPADLSSYTELRLDVWLESGDPPLPGGATVSIRLGCTSAVRVERGDQSTLGLVRDVVASVKSGWIPLRLAISGFKPSDGQAELGLTTASCLSKVDGISFSVNGSLADGQTAAGTLHLDDIRFVGARDR